MKKEKELYYVFMPVGNDLINVTKEEAINAIILCLVINHNAKLKIDSSANIFAKDKKGREQNRCSTLKAKVFNLTIYIEAGSYADLKENIWKSIEKRTNGFIKILSMNDWFIFNEQEDAGCDKNSEVVEIRKKHRELIMKESERVKAGLSEASISIVKTKYTWHFPETNDQANL